MNSAGPQPLVWGPSPKTLAKVWPLPKTAARKVRKIRMNIARVQGGLGILCLMTACATQHSEQTAAPVASPSSANFGAAPAMEQEPAAPPAAAPAPQGLDQPKSAESARDEE